MKTFVRVAEVWVPSSDGSLLELAGGLFDAAPAFGALSRSMCFGRAEGLPGRALDEGRPVMLTRLDGSIFRHAVAARAAGLTCAVALPTFVGRLQRAAGHSGGGRAGCVRRGGALLLAGGAVRRRQA